MFETQKVCRHDKFRKEWSQHKNKCKSQMGQDQVSGGVSVICWLAARVAMFYGNLQNLVIRSKSIKKWEKNIPNLGYNRSDGHWWISFPPGFWWWSRDFPPHDKLLVPPETFLVFCRTGHTWPLVHSQSTCSQLSMLKGAIFVLK